MAHFLINDGNTTRLGRSVEAEGYRADERFVHFFNSADLVVLSIRTDHVFTIERK